MVSRTTSTRSLRVVGLRGHVALAGIAMALVVTPLPGLAEVVPSLTLGVSHTDNLRLTADNTQDETIFSAQPALRADYQRDDLTALLDYRMQWLRFDDAKETEVFHTYTAQARYSFVEDETYIDVGGSRFQSIRDPLRAIPLNNIPISGNRIDRDEYFVQPTFSRRLGPSITVGGSYRGSWVDLDAPELEDSTQGRANFSIDNYAVGDGLTLALLYDWQRVEYESSIPFEYQRARAEIGTWLGGSTRIFGSVGVESEWDNPLDPALEADVWEAGLSYQPSERLSLELAAGERSFGASSRIALAYNTRRGELALSFVQDPTTQGVQRLRVRGPSDPDLLTDVLTVEGQTQRFISNRVDASWEFRTRRLALQLRVFAEDRTDAATADGTPIPDREQRGLAASVEYQLGARSRVLIRSSRQEFEVDGVDRDLTSVNMAMDYRLGARTTVTLNYGYTDQGADDQLNAEFDGIFANVISLFVRRDF